MKKLICLLFLFGFYVSSPPTRADFYDNFDSYTNSPAFMSVWTANAGTGLILNTNQFVSAPNSVINPLTNAASVRIQIQPVAAATLDFSFSFYDYTGLNSRDYGMLYAKGGSGTWADTTQNILAIGKYNNLTTSKYYGRIFLTSGVVFGDGITTNASGWFDLGGAANRSIGWHTAQITGMQDPNNPSKAVYQFYIDGVLGGSLSNAVSYDYNWTVLGSGLSTATPIAFDNLVVIPEPSSVLLAMMGLGVLSFAWMKRRRAHAR